MYIDFIKRNLFEHWNSFVNWARPNKFWVLVYAIAAVICIFFGYSFKFVTIIFLCIIFVQIYTDPIEYCDDENDDNIVEDKRTRQRYRWMVFAYGFMLMSLVLVVSPFVEPILNQETSEKNNNSYIKTLRERPITVFIGCATDAELNSIKCITNEENQNQNSATKTTESATWVMNIGGYIKNCDNERKDAYGKTAICEVSNGLVVPLYFIILALMGGSISLTRRLPELQKQASREHIATEQQPKMTQHEFREHLIFQMVQYISAPFLAILAYYLAEPNDTKYAVILAFTAGFASETILLMVRSIGNKLAPQTNLATQYGAVVGVVTNEQGKPEKNVKVSLSALPQAPANTDDQGFYILNNVPVGEHGIEFASELKGVEVKKEFVKIERARTIVKKNVAMIK